MTVATLLVLVACSALGIGLVPRLSAFTGPDAREGLVASERPLSLNPLIGADTPAVHDVGHLLYRSLLRLDASAYPQPDLASGYAVDQSGLVYTVRLVHGQRWSDGKPITAADVLATFSFAQSKRANDRSVAGGIAGVHAKVSGDAIVFTLPTPRVSFIATLTQIPILPLGGQAQQQIAALPAQTSTPMPTSGPFRVLSSDSVALELVSNQFAASPPALSRFELRLYGSFDDAAVAFAHGDVDAVLATTPSQRARLLSQPQAVAHDIATFRFVDLLFNQRVSGLDDAAVRHAIGTVVDRQALVSGALFGSGGFVETDAITRGLPWISSAAGDAQPSADAARSALDAAGWVPGPGGVRQRNGVTLSFGLLTPDSDPLPRVANQLAQQLTQIGVGASVQVVQAASFVTVDLAPHAFQLALADWDGGPDPDVSAFWRSNASPPDGFYVSGGDADPFLDQALDMLSTLGSRSGRIAAAQSVSMHLHDDVPAVFLYTPMVSYVMRGPLAAAGVPRFGSSEARYEEVALWRRN